MARNMEALSKDRPQLRMESGKADRRCSNCQHWHRHHVFEGFGNCVRTAHPDRAPLYGKLDASFLTTDLQVCSAWQETRDQ
jgi:hypothetical protein